MIKLFNIMIIDFNLRVNKALLLCCYSAIYIFTIISCTEIIDLPLDESEIKLVVEGTITTDTTTHTILLTQTTGYYYDKSPPPVTKARVVIDDGETTFVLTEKASGVYQTANNFYGIEGKTYTLKIELDAPLNGFKEFSASAYMHNVVTLDSVKAEFRSGFGEQGIWEVKCWLQDPPTTDFYRIELLRNNVVITSNIGKWITSDDSFFNGQYLSGTTIAFLSQNRESERLVSGDVLGVKLFRISREYYNFIEDVKTELRGSNPLFSGPGANVRGNISNGAIGFFTAYPVSRAGYKIP
jgi:hypothetical protein